MKKNNVRLEKHVMPMHYEITLRPDLGAHIFSGQETITLKLQKSVKEITLHSKDLNITSASLLDLKLGAKRIVYDKKSETATFVFGTKIPKGEAKLHITFNGILADNMRGFYKSKYVVNGEARFMATTQFEATDARRCIPCFDEPTHKAVFKVHLVIPNGKTAISNTLPEIIKEHEAGFKIVSFAPTPKMSTYLLAFIVGDFEWIEKKTKSGVLVRVMTVPGKKHQAKFSLDVTVRCLEFYEKYFDIPYPLNTLDMVAIPDFSSLAMENWGAITFREIGLLLDVNQTSTGGKELIVEVIAHELAHQWFGNLVTMEWWTHLWLNEGFASYISYVAVEALFPEFDIWPQFVGNPVRHGLTNALKLDALKYTHPIEVEVHHPNEIGEVFDAISYDKGSSIIRMLREYLGERNFRDGLRFYLKKHSYNNASTMHLWEAFEKVSGKPIKKMMAIWTRKPGYPIISIKEKNNKIEISQERYYSSETSRKQNKDKTIWPIPISLISNKEKTWFKANKGETGLYRTNYDPKFLGLLQNPIVKKELGAVDRLGIIRDLFNLSESGYQETQEALKMLQSYKNETGYIVWIEIISGLRAVANILAGTESEEKFRAYAREILKNITNHVGWAEKKNETHNQSLMRPLILGAASSFGNKNVIAEAKKKFKNRKQKSIDADLRSVVYGTVVREGGIKEYKEILAMYNAEPLHEEKNRLLGALCTTRDKKLLKQTLEFIMSDKVRMQDRNSAFAGILISQHGRALGWDFIKKNWEKIGEAYGEGNHLLSRLISALSRNTNREIYNDIKKFFKTNSAPSAERTILQTLEQIDSNINWLKRDKIKIEKWLKNRI